MKRTLATDYDLVCDDIAFLPVIGSSYMAGVVVATMFAGFLSDRFGRRPVMLAMCATHVIASFVTYASKFAGSFTLYLLARFFVGGSIHMTWSVHFVFCMEVTKKDRRGWVGAIYNLGWGIGSIIMALSAFVFRAWDHMQLFYATFGLLLVLNYILVPESPRFNKILRSP